MKCTNVDLNYFRKSYDFLPVRQRRGYIIYKNIYSRVRKEHVNVSQRMSSRTAKIIINLSLNILKIASKIEAILCGIPY